MTRFLRNSRPPDIAGRKKGADEKMRALQGCGGDGGRARICYSIGVLVSIWSVTLIIIKAGSGPRHPQQRSSSSPFYNVLFNRAGGSLRSIAMHMRPQASLTADCMLNEDIVSRRDLSLSKTAAPNPLFCFVFLVYIFPTLLRSSCCCVILFLAFVYVYIYRTMIYRKKRKRNRTAFQRVFWFIDQ